MGIKKHIRKIIICSGILLITTNTSFATYNNTLEQTSNNVEIRLTKI